MSVGGTGVWVGVTGVKLGVGLTVAELVGVIVGVSVGARVMLGVAVAGTKVDVIVDEGVSVGDPVG